MELRRVVNFAVLFTLIILTVRSISQSSESPQQVLQEQTKPATQTSSPVEKERRSADQNAPTVLRTTTRLVVVNVVAADGKNRPVTDFAQQDFRLLEDGKEQQISVFAFQHPKPEPAVAQALVELPPNMYTNFPRYREDDTLNVVLLDGLNSNMENQAFAQHQVVRFLEKLGAGQPLAVYALFSDLRLLQDFGGDPKALQDTLKNLKGHTSLLLENPTTGGREQPLPETRPGVGQNANLASSGAERTRYLARLRAERTREALVTIAHALSDHPGRKNLIWLSEGFPMSVTPSFDLGLDADSVDTSTEDFSHDIAKAADALMENQIAIYPVDVRGLATLNFGSASQDGERRGFTGRNAGHGFSAAHVTDSRDLASHHATLDLLAERTGGKAFYNRNDLDDVIRKSIDDGSTYYTLGYYPSNKNWDDKFRKIEVKVNRPDVKLRHRLGYYAVDPRMQTKVNAAIDPKLDPKQLRAQTFVQALSLDVPASAALIFKAGVFPPSPQTRNKVMVSFAIDAQTLSFENQENGVHHATVDCGVQVYSEKGNPVKAEIATFDAALRPETFKKTMQNGFLCQQLVDLPSGNYILRLGVIDDHSGLIGTTNARIAVPAVTEKAKTEKKE